MMDRQQQNDQDRPVVARVRRWAEVYSVPAEHYILQDEGIVISLTLDADVSDVARAALNDIERDFPEIEITYGGAGEEVATDLRSERTPGQVSAVESLGATSNGAGSNDDSASDNLVVVPIPKAVSYRGSRNALSEVLKVPNTFKSFCTDVFGLVNLLFDVQCHLILPEPRDYYVVTIFIPWEISPDDKRDFLNNLSRRHKLYKVKDICNCTGKKLFEDLMGNSESRIVYDRVPKSITELFMTRADEGFVVTVLHGLDKNATRQVDLDGKHYDFRADVLESYTNEADELGFRRDDIGILRLVGDSEWVTKAKMEIIADHKRGCISENLRFGEELENCSYHFQLDGKPFTAKLAASCVMNLDVFDGEPTYLLFTQDHPEGHLTKGHCGIVLYSVGEHGCQNRKALGIVSQLLKSPEVAQPRYVVRLLPQFLAALKNSMVQKGLWKAEDKFVVHNLPLVDIVSEAFGHPDETEAI